MSDDDDDVYSKNTRILKKEALLSPLVGTALETRMPDGVPLDTEHVTDNVFHRRTDQTDECRVGELVGTLHPETVLRHYRPRVRTQHVRCRARFRRLHPRPTVQEHDTACALGEPDRVHVRCSW